MWLRLIAIPLVLLLFGCKSPAQRKFYSGSTSSDGLFLIDREDALDALNPLPATTKSAPSLHLQYSPPVQTFVTNGMKIALMEPRYHAFSQATNESEQELSPQDMLPERYRADMVPTLSRALQTDLGKILVANGFIVSKVSDTMGALSPVEKREIDLIAAIRFDFGPLITNHQKILRYPAGILRVVNQGIVELAGSLTIEFIEPASGRTIITKQIDAALLRAAPAEYENQFEAENNFILLVNRAYPLLMAQIEKRIKGEEFLTALSGIRQLKEKHQPAALENKTP